MAKKKFNKDKNANCPNEEKKPFNPDRSGNKKGKDNEQLLNGKPVPKKNEWSWYDNDQLLEKAAKVSFCNALGDKFDLSTAGFDKFKSARMPGIMTFTTYSGIGRAKDNTDAVNIAAQEMYSKVRNMQSSAARYGKQDLMMYYITIEQALILYWVGARALGVTNYINRLNRYIPWNFSRALGFDLAEIAGNANRFATILDKYAKQLASYAIPAGFVFQNRHKFLFSNVFIDGTEPKSKFYIARPAGYFQFGLDTESKGKLTWKGFDYTTLFTIDSYERLLTEVINAFHGDEDFGTMSGDIIKTFPNNLVGWDPISIDYTVTPLYDEFTLVAFHNANALGPVISGDITQDPAVNHDFIICDPRFNAATTLVENKLNPILGKRILDVPDKYPVDYKGIAEATRLMNIPVYDDSTKQYYFDGATSIDIVTNVDMYYLHDGGAGAASIACKPLYFSDIVASEGATTWGDAYIKIETRFYTQALASEFKYAPVRFVTTVELTNGTPTKAKPLLMSSISNYSILDKQFLTDLHAVCTMSLFSTKKL